MINNLRDLFKRIRTPVVFILLITTFDKIIIEFLLQIFPEGISLLTKSFFVSKEPIIFLLSISIIIIALTKYFKFWLEEDKGKVIYDVIIISILFYYSTFRSGTFFLKGIELEVSSYSLFQSIKYLDFIVLLGFLSVCRLTYSLFKSSKILENNSIWENDKPLINLANEDIFNRNQLVEKIADQINCFSDGESSFSIGIIGPWGTGKSTFMGALQSNVSHNSENVIVMFNPWLYNDKANLTRVFLDLIGKKLSRYSFSINRINDYASTLFKGNINWWGTLSNLIFKERDIDQIREQLNKSILNSGKRLVIFIDDVDRLQVDEVYEILTIIRNIGNLSNTIFILAYDKDYLLNILRRRLYNPQRYLSKFFQVEFALGRIRESDIRNLLKEKLENGSDTIFVKKEISSKSSADESDFENAERFLHNFKGLFLLKNKRDIIKLMNVVNIIWPVFKDSLIFKDFFTLEILRLKYGNIYSKIKYKDSDFIIRNENRMAIVFNRQVDLTKLVKDVNDRDLIINMLVSIFPSIIEGIEHESDRMSVCHKFKFDAYFQNNEILDVSQTLDDLR